MNWFTNLLSSSLGQKIIMSVTGLFLIAFLVVHLIGNLLLFKADGGATFNAYAHFMSTAFVIRIAEIILVFGFVIHIYTAWRLNRYNQTIRCQDYIYNCPNANSSWSSRHMGLTGSVVLVFLVVHLHNFWFRYHVQTDLPRVVGTEYKSMYLLTKVIFQQEWWFAVWYIVAMVLLGFHLTHGFASAFQTLGLQHKKYTPLIQTIGLLVAIMVPIGFAAMPLYFLILAFFS